MFPEINSPQYLSPDVAVFLKNEDTVYVKEAPDGIYVYPAMILAYHHIVNDNSGLFPSILTLCLLTDTVLSYSRMVDGKFLDFAVLGPLYYGNLVMYDKQSDSYWHQLTGESFAGKFKGQKLNQDARVYKTTWKQIKNKKKLKILGLLQKEKFYRDFYARYNNSVIGLQSLKGKVEINTQLSPVEKGFGIDVNGGSKFYPVKFFGSDHIFFDKVGGIRIIVYYEKSKNYLRAYRAYDPLTGFIKGDSREQIDIIPSYWYSWAAFFPKTLVYQ